MASKISKKQSLNIKGIFNIDDGKIMIDVEDIDNPVDLANISKEFEGKEVTISINNVNELA